MVTLVDWYLGDNWWWSAKKQDWVFIDDDSFHLAYFPERDM